LAESYADVLEVEIGDPFSAADLSSGEEGESEGGDDGCVIVLLVAPVVRFEVEFVICLGGPGELVLVCECTIAYIMEGACFSEGEELTGQGLPVMSVPGLSLYF
jgi:hypothetical protein